jgi:hypothetical protein
MNDPLGIGQRESEDLDRRPDALDLREPLAAEGPEDLVPAGTRRPTSLSLARSLRRSSRVLGQVDGDIRVRPGRAPLWRARPYPEDMARRAEEIPDDPVLVLIEDGEPDLTTFDEWLATLAGDEPTEIDADAAEILREIREHGER